MRKPPPHMSEVELLALDVTVDIVTAGRAFGIGREKSYELAKAGDFPCDIVRLGVKYRVTKAALFAGLGRELPAPSAGAA